MCQAFTLDCKNGNLRNFKIKWKGRVQKASDGNSGFYRCNINLKIERVKFFLIELYPGHRDKNKFNQNIKKKERHSIFFRFPSIQQHANHILETFFERFT